jgi:hypothetical protein
MEKPSEWIYLDYFEKHFLTEAIKRYYPEYKAELEKTKSIVSPKMADNIIHNLRIKLNLELKDVDKD